MAVETIFLVVLVIALVIGNILLSFIPSNGGQKNSFAVSYDQENNLQGGVIEREGLSKEEIQTNVLFSNFSALNQKINLTSNQLDILNGKLKKLENFKANTAVELKALKEILIELQNKYLTASSKKVRKSSPKLSTKQMHKIIYRSK